MKKRIRHLLDKAAEPRTEKMLLVFLPFLTLVLVALILAPGILSILEDAPLLPPESAATAEPMEAEGLARLPEEELALPVSTPMPAPAPTPEPIIVSESGALLGWQQIAGSIYYYDRNGTPVTGMQTIDGKLYFFDQYGVKAERLGIDVSFYNKFITWPAVAAQGIDFAILRAGGRGWETGLIYDDRWFQRNLAEARNAGIDLGVYFFSTATNPAEAEQEALYVLDCLGGTELELPIFIDVEYSGDYPHGRADRLSNTQRELIINAFCRTVMDYGYEAGVYSGQNYFKFNLDMRSLTKYTVWLASYTKNARLPDYPGHYDLWQFTDSGHVNGISGIVDMNMMFTPSA